MLVCWRDKKAFGSQSSSPLLSYFRQINMLQMNLERTPALCSSKLPTHPACSQTKPLQKNILTIYKFAEKRLLNKDTFNRTVSAPDPVFLNFIPTTKEQLPLSVNSILVQDGAFIARVRNKGEIHRELDI